MLEIAGKEKNSKGVFQKDIAASQNLSNKYLDQIIHALKTANLIRNVKGKKSGYVLTRDSKDITVYDIHRAFEPGLFMVECLSCSFTCGMAETCHARPFWCSLQRMVTNYFRSVTLADLLNRHLPEWAVDMNNPEQKPPEGAGNLP